MNLFNSIKKYMTWKTEYFGRTPVYPYWNYRIRKHNKDIALRHFIDQDKSVVWELEGDYRLPHFDHVEMSGFYVSAIISYGVNRDGSLALHRHCIYPMLRKIPNNTGGSLSHNFTQASSTHIMVDDVLVNREFPNRITLNGYLKIESRTNYHIDIVRKIFPSPDYPALIEKVTIVNSDDKSRRLTITPSRYVFKTKANKGVSGIYELHAGLCNEDSSYHLGEEYEKRSAILAPGSSLSYFTFYAAIKKDTQLELNAAEEEMKREHLITELAETLILETSDEILNTSFRFAKLRACESIFKTKNGLMHAPGGGSFYAALWTNDQCEYVNPLFPFVGYEKGNEQAINCYSLYMDRMDKSYEKDLVTSVIAEGDDYWNGAGDRGDGAMFAYGAARFCLSYGDAYVAVKLWKGIEWALEYSLRKKNEEGVIKSDSDELENRFESGDANLFTSCLLYDALISTVYLGTELKKPKGLLGRYQEEATKLKKSIEEYYGANVEGFDTYRYYKENNLLRAWICVPLTMGIYDRSEGTIKALFSDRLWSKDGLRTQSTKDTFWDRATLYALRGVFAAGETQEALKHLQEYTAERLLGEHVPYSLEAYPEGNGSHLSAESGLYVRIYTEGLFGIRPTGFKSFTLTPRLPSGWNKMSLRQIKAFGTSFDLEILGEDKQIRVRVIEREKLIYDTLVTESEALHIKLT